MNSYVMKKSLVILLVFVLLSTALTGCGGNNASYNDSEEVSANESVTKEKIVRFSASGTPKIDPAVGMDTSSCIALVNLYDTLVYPEDDGTLRPMAAEKWDIDESGLKYTFYLKKGIKFHSGNELTANDVVFSMKRLIDIGEGFASLFTDVIKDAVAVDESTVEFTLNKKFGPFLETLVRLYILDEKTVMQNLNKADSKYGDMGDYGKDWLITNDAGSGPYKVKELKQQEYLSGTKFDEYWGGWDADAPDSFKIIDNTEGTTIRTLMTNRELEITDQWQTKENIDAMGKIPGVSIDVRFSGTNKNIMLHTKKAPTDDVNFRKALAFCYDYAGVINEFPGSYQPRGPVPHDLPGWNENTFQYTTDLEKAKEYLLKSKYANELDKYPVELYWITDVPDDEKIALTLQAQAQKIGIKVEVKKAPWISYVDLMSTIESTPNAAIISVSPDYNEAGSMLKLRYGSKSCGTWQEGEWLQSAELDAKIEDALSTVDRNERFEKYAKLQEEIASDLCPTIWALDSGERRAYQSDYVYWPSAELIKEGKSVTPVLGYYAYFHDFKVYPDKIPE
jgi:peptide/nickel transport system substrate-binding protein